MTNEYFVRSRKRRGFAAAAVVVATVALAASLVVAATVVSIGIARADTLGTIAATGNGTVALGAFVALIAAMAGLTAAMARIGRRPRPGQ
jgi:hypothetical protein